MKLSQFVVLCAALACQSVGAGSNTLARQFVELLQYSQQFDEAHTQCLKSNSAIPPEKVLNLTPENPGPVPPGSTLWPKVVAAYEVYWRDICARPTRDEYLAVIAGTYARTLDDAALEASIRFYSSPAGARLIQANNLVVRDVYVEWQRLNAQTVGPAVGKLQRALESIGEEAAIAKCRERASTHTAEGAPCPMAKTS